MTSDILLTDEMLERCFGLAMYLLPERKIALYVVIHALDRLTSALLAQDKRVKHDSRSRTKVLLTDLQLVQRLILLGSEKYEKEQEQNTTATGPSDEDMLVRWFAHNIRISLDNSFYVTVNKCRILHRYSTLETRDLYEFALQDPDRGKDDDKYRRVKRRFMQSALQRFSGRICLVRGGRGEDRFECLSLSAELVDLALECQRQFAPWNVTALDLPPGFRAGQDIVPGLRFAGGRPDDEADAEVRRMHCMIFPESFASITNALGLPPAAERLTLPIFETTMPKNHTQTPTSARRRPPSMTPEEKRMIREILRKQSVLRDSLKPESLIILVNGEDRAVLDLNGGGSLKFGLTEFDRYIEVVGLQGTSKAVLAFLFVVRDDEDRVRPCEFTIELKEGQTLSLAIDEGLAPEVRLSYEETQFWRSAALEARRQMQLRRVQLERVTESLLTSPGGVLASVNSVVWPEIGVPRGGAATHVCPNCGGLLTRTPSERATGTHLPFWRCDRCPFLCAATEDGRGGDER